MNTLFKLLLISILYLASHAANAQSQIDIHMNKAQKAIDEENYTDAVKHISKALEYRKEINSSYKVANLYISRGMCRLRLKNYSEAEADMDQALKIAPEFMRAFESKNIIYSETRQYDKIIDNSGKALNIDNKNENFLKWISQAYMEKHDYNKALVYVDSALGINPDDLQSLNFKTGILHRLKKDEEAIEINNQILAKKPNDPGAYLNRGINYASLKQYDKAEADNNFAAKIDTSLAYIAYNNTAYFIKIDSKDYTGAIELFNKCIAIKPDFSYAYSNRGFCKMQLGDLAGANKDILKSLELDPTNSYAYKNLAILRIKQNKINEACGLLKKAVDKGYTQEYDNEVEELIKANNCK